MISPYTAPGTKVVCIADSAIVLNTARRPRASSPYPQIDHVYTVGRIEDEPATACGFACSLQEMPSWAAFALTLFRYLELPPSITRALTSQPDVQDERIPVEAA